MKPAIFVAEPTQMGSTPVASGSRVPVCPAFSTLSSERTRRTTSNEVGPAGLSITRMPFITCSGAGRSPTFLVLHLAQEAIDLVPLNYRLVEDKVYFRGDAQLNAGGDLAADESLCRFEAFLYTLAFFTAGQRRIEYLGHPQIGRDLHPSNGDEADPRIAKLPSGNERSHRGMDFVPHTIGAHVCRHFFSHSRGLRRLRARARASSSVSLAFWRERSPFVAGLSSCRSSQIPIPSASANERCPLAYGSWSGPAGSVKS